MLNPDRNAAVLSALDPAFAEAVSTLIDRICDTPKLRLCLYDGRRTLNTQAKLWRRSRSAGEIDAAERRLIAAGAPLLAQALVADNTTFDPGAPLTNRLPGLDWRCWGLTVSCIPIIDGVPDWAGAATEHMLTLSGRIGGCTVVPASRNGGPNGYLVIRALPMQSFPVDRVMSLPEVDAAFRAAGSLGLPALPASAFDAAAVGGLT